MPSSTPSLPTAVVVNDDLTQLNILAGLLRKANLIPQVFSNAEAALQFMLETAAPALIVTDLYMPILDGWRFCRLLRSEEYASLNAIPIMVVSATFTGEESHRITMELGVNLFMPAPVDGARFITNARLLVAGEMPQVRARTLILEDSPTLTGLLGKALLGQGYQPDTAASLAEAFQLIRQNKYDLAVMDYHLPDGQGDLVLDQLRVKQPDCVCIMMTSDPQPHLALDWMKRGAAAYLRKPFAMDYLLEVIGRARREQALLRVEDLLEARTRELSASEAQYRALLEHTVEGIFRTTPDGRYLSANPALARLFGYDSPQELINAIEDIGRDHYVNPQERETFKQLLLTRGQVQGFETQVYTKQRQPLWVSLFARVVKTAAGEIDYFEGTIINISERKQAEQKQAHIQAQLIQAQKMESIGALAGGVAHDFNNMLSVVRGHAELGMLETQPERPVWRRLKQILEVSQRSTDLVRQLLAFARKQIIEPRVLNINHTVEQMLSMLQHLIGEHIHLNWRPASGQWQVRLDPVQIDQILVNLCVNARDAIAGTGSITIETQAVTLDEACCAHHLDCTPGDYVLLSITDTGNGIPPKSLPHIFDPFYTTKEAGRGTGLGLATVYGIVKQNRGYITVYSEPVQGTCFKIYLPRHLQAPPATTARPKSSDLQGGHEIILLVEDNAALLEMGAMMLKTLGYQVLCADTPQKARHLAEEHSDRIDLLLTDVILPDMNGRELASRLTKQLPHLRCLFMSGYTADIIAQQGVLDGGVQFIQKPFSLHQLAGKVREVMEG